MLSAAVLPILDPASALRSRPDAQLVQLDQPLPEWPEPYRHGVVWDRADTHTPRHDQTRICTHWPVDGVAHIQTVARSLRGMAASLASDGPYDAPAGASTESNEKDSGCFTSSCCSLVR